MTKSFEDIVEQFKAPESEWEVLINGQNFTNRIELIELEHKINNSMKFTIKLSGVESSDKIPVDSEAVVKYDGGEILRGVLKEFNPNENNEYVFEGAGYAVELEADSKTVFENEGVENPVKDTTVQEIVDTLVLDTPLPNNRTLSTEFSGGSGSIQVNDFRVKKRQMSDVNRLVGEYSLEWYVVTDSSNNPVLEVTDQIFFSAAPDNAPGNPKETFKTFGKDQNATRVEQNVNRNIGDFDGVVVRGFGDGDDQIEAKSKNDDFGKGSRTLIFTDKTILSQSQAQRKADNLSETQTVDWQEVEVEPMNPNQIFGIGDEIRVNSERARLSDTFRVVELYYKIHPERQILESKINLSNKPQTFVDDFKRLEETSKSQTDFGQGNRNTINESNQDLAGSDNQGDQVVNLDFNIPERFTKSTAGEDKTAQVVFDFAVKNYKKTFNRSQLDVSDDTTVQAVNEVTDFGDVESTATRRAGRNANTGPTKADVTESDTTRAGGGAQAALAIDDEFADDKSVESFAGTFAELAQISTSSDAKFADADLYFSFKGRPPGDVTINTPIVEQEFDIVLRNQTDGVDLPKTQVMYQDSIILHTNNGTDSNGDPISDFVEPASINGHIHLPGKDGLENKDFSFRVRPRGQTIVFENVSIDFVTYARHKHKLATEENAVDNIQAFLLKPDASLIDGGLNGETSDSQVSDGGTTTVGELEEDDIILSREQTQASELTVKVNGTELSGSPFALSGDAPFKKSDIQIPLDLLNTPGQNTIELSTDETALVKGNVIVDHKVGGVRKE